LGVVVSVVLGVCSLSLGSEAGGHGGGHDSGKLLDLLYRFINFALLVIILFVVVRKSAIKDMFAARKEEIRKRLEDLGREKGQAETRYRELEKKLREFEQRKKELLAQYREEGLAEKERIIREAQQRAQQILQQADATIQREVQAARERLKVEVVNAAAEKARQMIAKEMKDSDQDRLVQDFIKKVEKLH
jgi:F-type H+-transporting ATPase subunit b